VIDSRLKGRARHRLPVHPTVRRIQQTEADAGVRAIRTYHDLLRNEPTRACFDYLLQRTAGADRPPRRATPLSPADYLDLKRVRRMALPAGRARASPETPTWSVDDFRPRHIECCPPPSDGSWNHNVSTLPLVECCPRQRCMPTACRNIGCSPRCPARWSGPKPMTAATRISRLKVAMAVIFSPHPSKPRLSTLARTGHSLFLFIHWVRGDWPGSLSLVEERE